MTYHVVAI